MKERKEKASRGKKGRYKSLMVVTGVVVIALIGGLYLGRVLNLQKTSVEFLVPPGGETQPTLSPSLFVGRIARAYSVAKEIPDVLDKVWCYCDCEIHSGHKSLKTCYTSKHAAYCDICLGQALMVNDLHKKGYPIEDIRKEVHKVFSS